VSALFLDEASTIASDAIRFVFETEADAQLWCVNCVATSDFNKSSIESAERLEMDRQRIAELQAEVDELKRQLDEESIDRIHYDGAQHVVTDSDDSGNETCDEVDSDTTSASEGEINY
jgi:hypothetical protein